MRLSGMFHFRKSRKYPIKRDKEGRSLRARCFEGFEGGSRPTEVAQELGMKEATVFRYFLDWRRRGPDFDKQYAFVKKLLKKGAAAREQNVETFSKMLGIEKEEFETILSQPHGLRRFLTGKLYFPINKDVDQKLHITLKLAVLFSDHLITDGGSFEDVYDGLKRYLKEQMMYRKNIKADIEDWNRDMELFHVILAADMEAERMGRIKPDTFSEEERNAIMRLGVEAEMKKVEIIYWARIGVLKAEGLTTEQAREKMSQTFIEKSDPKIAKMMREFQDKVHPLGNNDK